ncbi:hypothetical protein [Streptomyces xanthophaeus]|uniref:hypothetical protein n=1 Tax=Streptomyces xanthophaeus TaxID=67385 RepID=UPI0026498FBD|nr:hypothetical protein [Streptomyces xanthophaeus]WKD31979.1 hypothetical protein KO717_08465 [Streptomyces xanthophaeus]
MSKKHRSRKPSHSILVSDALELRAAYAMLCLRIRDSRDRVARVVLQAEAADDILTKLHQAAVETEEHFWPLAARFGDHYADFEAWLEQQDWCGLYARVPEPSPILLITHAGHVGMALDPPFAERRLIVVLSPAQLHRVRAGLAQAARQAAGQLDDPAVRSLGARRAAMALHTLRTQPLPDSRAGVPDPEEGRKVMLGLYADHLRRAPAEVRNPIR